MGEWWGDQRPKKPEIYETGAWVRTTLTGRERVRILNVWQQEDGEPVYRVEPSRGPAKMVFHGQIITEQEKKR